MLAFLNIPFDQRYESLYLAFIAGLSGFGLVPQAVLQVLGSQRRLDRLVRLLGACKYSLHTSPESNSTPAARRRHDSICPSNLGWLWQMPNIVAMGIGGLSEAKGFRVLKSLSDIDGTEVYIHRGGPIGVLRGLTNALARSRHRPTVRELQAVYRDVKQTAEILKQELATPTLFDTRPFLDLVLAASIGAKRRIASLR